MATNDGSVSSFVRPDEVASNAQKTHGGQDDDSNDPPIKKEKIIGPPRRCKYCRQRPCIMADGELYNALVGYFEDYIEPEYEQKMITEKEVRFKLYRHATFLIHGYLGRGVRKELPTCVRGEIIDLVPSPDGKYVGFKEAKSEDN